MLPISAVVLVACASVALGCSTYGIGAAKYQLSMISSNTNCAASILGLNFAITSAYCVKLSGGISAMKLVSGSDFYLAPGYTHQVRMATIHPLYNPTTFDYDIAILRVYPSFTYGATVGPIGLPIQGQATAVNTLATVTGWSTTCGPPVAPLNFVDLPVINCSPGYAPIPYASSWKICVKTTATVPGPCQGDRGGPMVVNSQLIGVRSFNPAAYCAAPGKPIIFIKVSMLSTWITTTMAAMG